MELLGYAWVVLAWGWLSWQGILALRDLLAKD